MSLREMLADYWYAFRQELFPRLESELGPMGERYELFVAVLDWCCSAPKFGELQTLLDERGTIRMMAGCGSIFQWRPSMAGV